MCSSHFIQHGAFKEDTVSVFMSSLGFWGWLLFGVLGGKRVFYFTLSSPALMLQREGDWFEGGDQAGSHRLRWKISSKLSLLECERLLQARIWWYTPHPQICLSVQLPNLFPLWGHGDLARLHPLVLFVHCQALCCVDFCPTKLYRLHCCVAAWSLDLLTFWNPPTLVLPQASPCCDY